VRQSPTSAATPATQKPVAGAAWMEAATEQDTHAGHPADCPPTPQREAPPVCPAHRLATDEGSGPCRDHPLELPPAARAAPMDWTSRDDRVPSLPIANADCTPTAADAITSNSTGI
jgi:hypothetical protein